MSENTEDDNLGEARIEAAYGSGDGDEDISATVASCRASMTARRR